MSCFMVKTFWGEEWGMYLEVFSELQFLYRFELEQHFRRKIEKVLLFKKSAIYTLFQDQAEEFLP